MFRYRIGNSIEIAVLIEHGRHWLAQGLLQDFGWPQVEPSYLVGNFMNELSDLTLIIETCYFDYTAFVFMRLALPRLGCIRLVIHLVIALLVIIGHLGQLHWPL